MIEMKPGRFIFRAFFICCLMLSAAHAQDSGDPDSEAATTGNIPPGWGDSGISVQDNNNNDNPDANSDNNPDDPVQVQNPDQAPAITPGETPAVVPPPIVPVETPSSESDDGDKWHVMKFARLQGLNKVTAKTLEIKADIGTKTKFGNLEFVAEKCLRGPENERAENTVLLTVTDEIPGQERKQIFHGWMFSSSPAISALEHPIYDIILLGCGEAPKLALPVETKKPETKKAKAKVLEKPKPVKQ